MNKIIAKQPVLPLAIQPKLQPRESLYSWLLRAASYNGLTASAFTYMYWPNKCLLSRELTNKKYPNHAVKSMVMELCKAQPCVFADFLDVENHHNTFILLVHCVRKKGQIQDYQYCPKCIAEQRENAYLPIEWDMASHTVCTKHHILLQNTCANCGKSYTPHKSGLRPIEQCASCGCDVTALGQEALAHPLYDGIDIPRLLNLQQLINNFIDNSICTQRHPTSNPKHDFVFNYMGVQLNLSDFLFLLIYFIRFTRYYSNIYKLFKNSTHKRFIERMKWDKYPLGYRFVGKFNTLSIVERAFLLSRACELLEYSADDWVKIAHELDIKQGFFTIIRKKDTLPEPLLRFIDSLHISERKRRIIKPQPKGAPKSLKQVQGRWLKMQKKIDKETR